MTRIITCQSDESCEAPAAAAAAAAGPPPGAAATAPPPPGAAAAGEAEDGASPSSSSSSSNSDGEISQKSVTSPANLKGTAAASSSGSSKKKPKSERSVVRDQGACCCRYCGWIYPNAHPSAKLRRVHRRHCSKFQSVHKWLDKSSSDSEEGSVSSSKTDNGCTDGVTMVQPADSETVAVEGESNIEQGITMAVADPHKPPSEGTMQGVVELEPDQKEEEISENLGQTQVGPEGTASKTKIEYVELKSEASGSMPQVADEGEQLKKILREQTTHDLLCPNCGSCITRRVILRKRKRVATPEKQPDKLLKLVETEVPEAGTQADEPSVCHEEETEYGCLACFSVFFRRVRSTRLGGLGLKRKALTETDESGEVGCLSFLLPDSSWAKKRLGTEPSQPSVQTDERAPSLDLPWTEIKSEEITTTHEEEGEIREVEVIVDLTQPRQTAEVGESSKPSQPVHTIRSPYPPPYTPFSCMPTLFPPYWREGEHVPENKYKASLSCLPVILPAYWGTYVREEPSEDKASLNCFSWETRNAEGNERAGLNCLPFLFSTTPRASQEAKVEVADESASRGLGARDDEKNKEEPSTTASETKDVVIEESTGGLEVQDEAPKDEKQEVSRCLPILLPSYKWGLAPAVKGDKPKEKETDCISFLRSGKGDALESPKATGSAEKLEETPKQYLTRETSIHAWIRTITSVVTVKPAGRKRDKESVDAVQVGNTTSFVDMKITDQPETLGKKKTEVLTTAPSTGWALLDALEGNKPKDNKITAVTEELEDNDGSHLIRKKRAEQPADIQANVEEIEELDESTKSLMPVEEPTAEPQAPKFKDEKATADTDLTKPLLAASEREVDVDALLEGLSQIRYSNVLAPPVKAPVSTTVSVKTPSSLVQVRGDDSKRTLETAIAIAEDIGAITQEQSSSPTESPEYVKSIVYGGLDISLASLAVVSSAAGAETKTINLLAMSLANLFAALITLLNSMGSLYRNDRAAFEEKVGQSFWVNGSIAVVSFLLFGSVAPVTYIFSFRTLDDRDYKFAATALASVACIVLLGLCKAYAQRKRYLDTIVTLIFSGFAAAVVGYFAGDYIKRWLQKIGFEDEVTPPAPAASPPPLFPGLENMAFLGRRGASL